jgi:hypothetical protein
MKYPTSSTYGIFRKKSTVLSSTVQEVAFAAGRTVPTYLFFLFFENIKQFSCDLHAAFLVFSGAFSGLIVKL